MHWHDNMVLWLLMGLFLLPILWIRRREESDLGLPEPKEIRWGPPVFEVIAPELSPIVSIESAALETEIPSNQRRYARFKIDFGKGGIWVRVMTLSDTNYFHPEELADQVLIIIDDDKFFSFVDDSYHLLSDREERILERLIKEGRRIPCCRGYRYSFISSVQPAQR